MNICTSFLWQIFCDRKLKSHYGMGFLRSHSLNLGSMLLGNECLSNMSILYVTSTNIHVNIIDFECCNITLPFGVIRGTMHNTDDCKLYAMCHKKDSWDSHMPHCIKVSLVPAIISMSLGALCVCCYHVTNSLRHCPAWSTAWTLVNSASRMTISKMWAKERTATTKCMTFITILIVHEWIRFLEHKWFWLTTTYMKLAHTFLQQHRFLHYSYIYI